MVAAFIIAAILSSSPPVVIDTTFVLRYNLPIGTSYQYNLVSDQFIVPKTAARLHSRLSFDVLSRDLASNVHCHMRLESDTIFRPGDNSMYVPEGDLKFVGDRLYGGVGYLDVLLDEFGHILRNKHHMVEDSSENNESESSVSRATDAGTLSGQHDVGPYGISLVLPPIPDAYEISVGKEYVDTILFASKLIHMPTSYGTSGNPERKLYYDTLIRISRLDSACTDEFGALYGYMTLRGDRRNAFGARFSTETSLIRDMRTGLVTWVTELCYQLKKKKKPIKYYRVTAELATWRRLKR